MSDNKKQDPKPNGRPRRTEVGAKDTNKGNQK